LDKSAQDVQMEGAILSEMLEIVAKRAALRPSDQSGNMSLQSDVSLPVLPAQTTINPLLQFNQQSSSTAASTHQRYPSNQSSSNGSSITHHTFTSQTHNQEHDVSSYYEANNFLFDGTEHIYLRTNLSLLHDCELLMEKYENQFACSNAMPLPIVPHWPQINAHTVLVIMEFLILYIAILYYSHSRQ
jgi:hypothetical protein